MTTMVTRFTKYGMRIETAHRVYVASYKTVVCAYDKQTKELARFWDGYSKSTMSHIRRVKECSSIGYMRIWEDMPVKKPALMDEYWLIQDYVDEKGKESDKGYYWYGYGWR